MAGHLNTFVEALLLALKSGRFEPGLAKELARRCPAHRPAGPPDWLRELAGRPIDEPARVAGWKLLPSAASPEPLAALGPFAELHPGGELASILSNAVYFGEIEEGGCFLGAPVDRSVSLLSPFARRGVAERLAGLARRLAPHGLHLVLYDCFRPLQVQSALFEAFLARSRREQPGRDEQSLREEAQTYVSLPSPRAALAGEEPSRHASPHSTGGAVDLGLIEISREGRAVLGAVQEADAGGLLAPLLNEQAFSVGRLSALAEEELRLRGSTIDCGPVLSDLRERWLGRLPGVAARGLVYRLFGRELEMGTPFDYFGVEAASAYFESAAGSSERGSSPRRNRRILFHLMKDAGFENYEEEWWHFSCGDGMAARKKGLQESLYHTANFGVEDERFEISRRVLRRALLSLTLR